MHSLHGYPERLLQDAEVSPVKSSVLVLMLGTALSVSVSAQNQVIDETKLVTLHGTVHPLALPHTTREDF